MHNRGKKGTVMDDDKTKPNGEEQVEDQDEQVPPSSAPEQEQEQDEQEPLQQDEEVEQDEDQGEEPPQQPSRREQLRVQDLLKKYGPPANRQAPSQVAPDFRSRVNAEEDIYKELEETAIQYGDQRASQAISQAEYTTWKRFLQMEESGIRKQYDVLDPSNKEKYHPALEKALQEKYLRMVAYDAGDPNQGIPPSVGYPDISYTDFVESEMEFADELASIKVSTATQNIAKQAATTGLRPDGSAPKQRNLNKAPEDMTDDELQAAIKATMPRDARGRFTSR